MISQFFQFYFFFYLREFCGTLPFRSRSEYLELLKRDLCTYYGYNEFLVDKFMNLFSVNEVCYAISTNYFGIMPLDYLQVCFNCFRNLFDVKKLSSHLMVNLCFHLLIPKLITCSSSLWEKDQICDFTTLQIKVTWLCETDVLGTVPTIQLLQENYILLVVIIDQ